MMNADSTRSQGRGKGLRRSAGLTITEVVVASSLLVLALVPALRALSAATLTQTKIVKKTESLALARGKLDEIRARCVYHYDESFTQFSVALDGAYLCTVSDNADADLRLLTVSVGYDGDGDGSLSSDEIQVTLATYVADCL